MIEPVRPQWPGGLQLSRRRWFGIALGGVAGLAVGCTSDDPRVAGGVTVRAVGDSGANPERSALVPGAYRPSSATTGPVAGSALSTIDGDVDVSTDHQLLENLMIKGQVNVHGYAGVVIRNCVITGPATSTGDTAIVIGAHEDLNGLVIEDSRLIGLGNVWCSAMRGGNYTIRRSEITNVPDGISLTAVVGQVTVESCWIHHGYYQEWVDGTAGLPTGANGYTHTDGVQFHRGKQYTIRGNVIGGRRVPEPHNEGHAAQISSGDDMYNSAILVKQEVDDSVENRIEHVLIEKNWLEGGASTLNIASGRGNDFASTVIRNNRFPRSTWGPQYYILRGPGLAVLTDNVFDDDGSPVPVSRGL